MTNIKITVGDLSFTYDISAYLEESSYFIEQKTVYRIPAVRCYVADTDDDHIVSDVCSELNEKIDKVRNACGLSPLKGC